MFYIRDIPSSESLKNYLQINNMAYCHINFSTYDSLTELSNLWTQAKFERVQFSYQKIRYH